MDTEISSVCSRNSSSSSSSDDGTLEGSCRLMSAKLLCELCHEAACLYCVADEARLCWDCDALIHSANFLVARHPRALICPSCGALTPGPLHLRPLPGLHFCQSCTDRTQQLATDWLDSDEESKVDCTVDSSDHDTQCLHQSALDSCCPSAAATTQKCSPGASYCSWTEGVGDSQDDDYTHLVSAGTLHTAASSDCKVTARYKRRKLTPCF